ncbi:MAG: MgtC/SapB family protein [Paludibacter sp.]|nr:MgtC/SapB family protein [Paludibacter sp.]
MVFELEHIYQILGALAAGSILGLEREYHSKPAGFRTMILICVSSCLFSILSANMPSGDRIASNIVTGIGFIGAGVVFKEGATVRGITSAAIIWMAAAIGMSIGFQHYILAAFVVFTVLLVMIALFKFEKIFDTLYQVKVYEIHFISADYSLDALEKEMKALKIQYIRNKIGKQNNVVNVEYNIVVSPTKKREQIDNFLINNTHIKGFEV